MELNENKVPFYFDESGSVGKADCAKTVPLLEDETEGEFESYKV